MVAKPLIRTCFVLIAVFGRMPVASAQVTVAVPEKQTAITHQESSHMTSNPALQDLMRISDHRAPNLAQNTQDFDVLYQQGQQAQQELTQMIQHMAWITKGSPMLPNVKSELRAKTKISTELNGQVDQLTDIARGTLVLNDIDSLLTAYQWLEQKAEIVEVKNRFRHPAQSGYRDMKCLVRLPQTDHIAEVQLHLEQIANIKNGVEHQIYETIQYIERRAQQAERPLNAPEQQRIQLLRSHSQRLYQTAWQYYQPAEQAA